MPYLSARSIQELAGCHPDIKRVVRQAIQVYDFSVICGHRGQEAQDKALSEGFSRLPYPESKHNKRPSHGVDLAPYPIDWKNTCEFYYMAGVVLGIAQAVGVKLKWGGRWTKIKDLPHFELDDSPRVRTTGRG